MDTIYPHLEDGKNCHSGVEQLDSEVKELVSDRAGIQLGLPNLNNEFPSTHNPKIDS